jgi:hypothetical protein
VGWAYSADDGTVDLIHQCYIAGALHRSGASVTDYAHDLLSHFTALGDYVDVFRWVVDVGAARASGKLVRRLEHAQGLELLSKPARLWSLGELLALLAALTRTAQPGRALSLAANGIAERLLASSGSGDTAWTFPRQTMHAAHGLAEYLGTKRWLSGHASD